MGINSRTLWLIFLCAFAITLFAAAGPVWMIHPFHHQTPAIVRFSYNLIKISPFVTFFTWIIALWAFVKLWGSARLWKKVLGSMALLVAAVCTWFTHQNHFEWMFHPLRNPLYARAVKADFLQPDDMVLAVTINGDDAAYPVRQLAYHHLVHDVVGGQPLIATY